MSHYTFKNACISCGNVPSYNGTLMCDPCTTGEVDTLWDWTNAVIDSELSDAVDYIMGEVLTSPLIDKNGDVDMMVATIMHIDQEVIDNFEKIVIRNEELNG